LFQQNLAAGTIPAIMARQAERGEYVNAGATGL